MGGAAVFITIQKVYYPLLCILGIPANLFTFYMICFRKCGMSKTAIIYLSFLSITDTSYLIWVTLLDLTLTFLQTRPFWHWPPWCSLLAFLQYGSLYSSTWIVVVFTIERFVVLSVIAARRHLNRARVTVCICVTIVLASHLASIPMCWINTVKEVSVENISQPWCRYRHATYSTVMVWITTFLSGGIPIILVIIFNCLIASHLARASRLFTKEEQRTMKGKTSKCMVRRSLLLLGTISVTFVVLSLPRFITYCILRTVHNDENFDRNDYGLTINVVADLSNMLQNLNSTTNFLLYSMVSRGFRQEMLHVLTCGAKARELGPLLTQTTMKVFTVTDHKPATSVDVVLTNVRHIEGH